MFQQPISYPSWGGLRGLPPRASSQMQQQQWKGQGHESVWSCVSGQPHPPYYPILPMFSTPQLPLPHTHPKNLPLCNWPVPKKQRRYKKPKPMIEIKDGFSRLDGPGIGDGVPSFPPGYEDNPLMEAQVELYEIDRVEKKLSDQFSALSMRTGMPITQENGQRRYGPPVNATKPPPKGCEVFVGKLPEDCFETELVDLFEKFGRIYEVRIMMDFNGDNRGFAFVQYHHPSEAQRAIEHMNNFQIRQGKYIGVARSIDNCRLFFGGLPTDKTQQEVFNEINRITENVVSCIVPSSQLPGANNRGFGFADYDCHKSAAVARRKFLHGRNPMWGIDCAVDWADSDIMDEQIDFTTITKQEMKSRRRRMKMKNGRFDASMGTMDGLRFSNFPIGKFE